MKKGERRGGGTQEEEREGCLHVFEGVIFLRDNLENLSNYRNDVRI